MGFTDIRSVLALDRPAMKKLAKKKDSLLFAHIIILVVALIGGSLAVVVDVMTGSLDLLQYASTPGMQATILIIAGILGAALAVGFTWLGVLIYHLWAKALGGSGSITGLFTVVGHGAVTGLVSWIPLVGWLGVIYNLVIDVNAIAAIEGISTGRAVWALVLTYVGLLLVIIMFVVALLALGFAVGLGSGLAGQL